QWQWREAQEAIRQKLPEYMVPSAIVELETMPVTANGKLDRKGLPKPEHESSGSGPNIIAPRDAIEISLKNLWEQVLDVENISISDDFFALGGHSFTAIALAARIARSFDSEVTVRHVFMNPTVELMACLLRSQGCLSQSSLVPIQPQGSRLPLFCIHPAGGSATCYITLARCLGTD